ncbi:hypothetical protein F5Y06DRAFT_133558 [Hypoxylon sp. FL0890]|nr:hypothetical protein F5Y06DRAFT_133558 [Hypoxylon sp. FL0890]
MDIKSDVDLDISNGTCYYARGKKAKKDYIPCGNVAAGVNWQCCVAGDICLSSSACWSPGDQPGEHEYAYLAGCTDSEYTDPMCPYKGVFISQQWVGLEPCRDVEFVWDGCKETVDVPDSELANCTCSSGAELIRTTSSLRILASLPNSLGGTIEWNEGVTPSISTSKTTVTSTPTTIMTTTSSSTSNTRATETATSTPSAGSSSLLPIATTTSTDASPVIPTPSDLDMPPDNTSDSNLSATTQAGIGIGVGIGAVIVGGLIFLAFFLRKRKNEQHNRSMTQFDFPNDANGQNSLAAPPPANDGGTSNLKEPGFVSELPADEPKRTSTLSSRPSSSVPTSPTGFLPQSHRLYTAYNPHLHGNYAVGIKSEKSRDLNPKAGAETPVSPLSPAIVVTEHNDKPEEAKENPKKEEEQTKEGSKKEQAPAMPSGGTALETIHELSG